MATAKPKSRTGRRRRVATVLGPPTDRALIVELLKELHHIVMDAGEQLGASAKDRRRALRLAAHDHARSRASQAATQRSYGIAGILRMWRSDQRYLRADGTPRVLELKGRGTTFATLARQFVPSMSVNEVAEMICQNAEVTRLEGNKLALLGSPVMFTPKTPESTLAGLALRFRRLAETTVYNAAIPTALKATGRFERLVTGELNEREFRAFSQSVRQQLQDLCDRVDAGFQQSRGPQRRTNRKKSGIGLYLFRDDGDIG